MAIKNIIEMCIEPIKGIKYRKKVVLYLVEVDKNCDQSTKEEFHNWQSIVGFRSKKEAIEFAKQFLNLIARFDCHPNYEARFMRIRKIKLGATCIGEFRNNVATFLDNIS